MARWRSHGKSVAPGGDRLGQGPSGGGSRRAVSVWSYLTEVSASHPNVCRQIRRRTQEKSCTIHLFMQRLFIKVNVLMES